jgi:DNA-binding beta-propeller fold protein YncE
LTLAGNTDLIYDSGTQRLYAAVGGNPGSIVPIDPVTGTFGTAIPAGNDPAKLALSDNGQYLYVGLNGEPSVQRVEVAAPHAVLPIPLGTGTLGGRFAEDLAVLPGSPQSIAVSLKFRGVSPQHAGVAIFDGALARSTMTPTHTGSNIIEFSASAATLYGYNNETTGFGFFRMAVDASGVSVVDVHDSFAPEGALLSGFGVDMKFGGGLIFATTGAVVDPLSRTRLGTVSLPVGFGNSVVPDAALGRVFYLTRDPATATWSLRAFDTATRGLLGSGSITGVNGTPGSLVRWGARGLAFRTSAGQIFLVESATLIP